MSVSSLSCRATGLGARGPWLGRRPPDYTLWYCDTLAYDVVIQFFPTIRALVTIHCYVQWRRTRTKILDLCLGPWEVETEVESIFDDSSSIAGVRSKTKPKFAYRNNTIVWMHSKTTCLTTHPTHKCHISVQCARWSVSWHCRFSTLIWHYSPWFYTFFFVRHWIWLIQQYVIDYTFIFTLKPNVKNFTVAVEYPTSTQCRSKRKCNRSHIAEKAISSVQWRVWSVKTWAVVKN